MKKKITKKEKTKDTGFALGKENYKLMAIGFAAIVLGFILMAGGGSDDPEVFNPEIFNFRRLTVAPLILLAGFIFEIYAIMKKPKDTE
jgi:membrane-bound ClpP family serine protease